MKRERRIKAAHNGEKGTTIKRCEEQFVKLRAMTKLLRHEKRSLYLSIVRDSRRVKAADVPVHSSLDWLNCTRLHPKAVGKKALHPSVENNIHTFSCIV